MILKLRMSCILSQKKGLNKKILTPNIKAKTRKWHNQALRLTRKSKLKIKKGLSLIDQKHKWLKQCQEQL